MTTLRDLPSIDRVLAQPAVRALVRTHGATAVTAAARVLQQEFRATREVPTWAGDPAAYADALGARLPTRGYRPVFNLTGTLIHTNLGRAPLPQEIVDAITPILTRPSNLEFDLETGRRGQRDQFVAERIADHVGAEAATIVNNNAAALLLVLNTFALGGAVPVSRGELIEIGGSFRLPAIMERSGCQLVEVGTTNRTHPHDFEAELAHARMLLKVHPSNYHIEGFTRTVSNKEMAALATRADIPFCVDLGSGTLVDLTRFGLPYEPTPMDVLREGADLVTFSGDKLLGSVQAGIIVGRADLISALNQNPLKRALRVDKFTLATLDATCALYDEPDSLPARLPVIRTLSTAEQELRTRADAVARVLGEQIPAADVEVVPSAAQIGSGALPDQSVPSIAVRLYGLRGSELERASDRLRQLPVPVIARINQEALWLDMHGADPLDELTTNLASLESPA